MTGALPWKTAWVTGASTGIGRDIVLQLKAAGVKVAASARSAEKLSALGPDIFTIPLDVTDAAACYAAVERIESELGPLDLVVFGRASGLFIEKALRDGIELREAGQTDLEAASARLNALNEREKGEQVAPMRQELQAIMQNHFGVFRTGEFMREGIAKLATLRGRVENVVLADRSSAFNTSRIECLELQNLFDFLFRFCSSEGD